MLSKDGAQNCLLGRAVAEVAQDSGKLGEAGSEYQVQAPCGWTCGGRVLLAAESGASEPPRSLCSFFFSIYFVMPGKCSATAPDSNRFPKKGELDLGCVLGTQLPLLILFLILIML